jgi:L-methionine (R)-S-oxide reductase
VCGAVAASGKSLVVSDVERFPGHIACDGASRSEIVVPIIVPAVGSGEGRLVGIIDVDCAEVEGFDELDREKLEELAELLARSCDWPEVEWVEELGEGIKKL